MKKLFTIICAVALISGFSVLPAMAGSSSTSQSAGSALIDQSGQSNVSEAMERGFPIPGRVGYGPVINYYGKPLPTSQFRPVESLLMYANIFSEGALEQIVAKGTDFIHELEIVQGPDQQVRASYGEGEVRWIKVIATTKMQADHGLIGYATSEADDRKTSMLEVMAQAALDAIRAGADVLQITAQGASRDTETSGWGIGFNTTQATMMGSGADYGNVSSGGTGYSTAWAGMRDKPWIQANVLKSTTKIVGNLELS